MLTSRKILGLDHAILLTNISYVVVQRIAVDGRAPSPEATVAHRDAGRRNLHRDK